MGCSVPCSVFCPYWQSSKSFRIFPYSAQKRHCINSAWWDCFPHTKPLPKYDALQTLSVKLNWGNIDPWTGPTAQIRLMLMIFHWRTLYNTWQTLKWLEWSILLILAYFKIKLLGKSASCRLLNQLSQLQTHSKYCMFGVKYCQHANLVQCNTKSCLLFFSGVDILFPVGASIRV